jgi:hypothetical protein
MLSVPLGISSVSATAVPAGTPGTKGMLDHEYPITVGVNVPTNPFIVAALGGLGLCIPKIVG